MSQTNSLVFVHYILSKLERFDFSPKKLTNTYFISDISNPNPDHNTGRCTATFKVCISSENSRCSCLLELLTCAQTFYRHKVMLNKLLRNPASDLVKWYLILHYFLFSTWDKVFLSHTVSPVWEASRKYSFVSSKDISYFILLVDWMKCPLLRTGVSGFSEADLCFPIKYLATCAHFHHHLTFNPWRTLPW